MVLTSLSLSDRVGRSIWIWETCKVNNDPAKVAEFLIIQTTSSPFTSDTCPTPVKNNGHTINHYSIPRFLIKFCSQGKRLIKNS